MVAEVRVGWFVVYYGMVWILEVEGYSRRIGIDWLMVLIDSSNPWGTR